METFFGDEARQLALALHGFEPFTEKVSAKQYEELLYMTHTAITPNFEQNKWGDKIEPYSGPQCHEDRDKKHLYEHNPDMRKKVMSEKV